MNAPDIAFDLGGGLTVFFSQHVGFRGDVRNLQTFDRGDSYGRSEAGAHILVI
jgi:hypothetical protein